MLNHENWEKIHKNSEIIKTKNFPENIYPSKCAQTFSLFHVNPELEKKKKVNFLDLGCGSGTNLALFIGDNFSTTAIDISESAIKSAKKRYKGDIKFIVGSSTDLPLSDNSQDFILADGSLNYCQSLEDYKKSINEIYRVLKTGGQARIYDHAYDDLMVKDANKKSDQIYYSKSKWEDSMPTICLKKETVEEYYSKYSNLIIGRESFNHISNDLSEQHSFWVITVTK